jgi:hypothetical protein
MKTTCASNQTTAQVMLLAAFLRLEEALQLVEVDAPSAADLEGKWEFTPFDHPVQRDAVNSKEVCRFLDATIL